MEEKLLKGKVVADALLKKTRSIQEASQEKRRLVVISVGNDPASKVYIRKKKEAAETCGYLFEHIVFEETTTEEEVLTAIKFYAALAETKGIIVQLPLPKHISVKAVTEAIPPNLDVDGFSYVNLGKVIANDASGLTSCTPNGIMYMLDYYGISMRGKHCVVVGRSTEVGKPIAMLMLNRDATVTICHSKTADLAYHTRQADILIVAVGQAGLITADMIKEDAVVVDVGINRNAEGKLCGDVLCDEQVMAKVKAITPVPGGVGPMTVAMLMHNTAIR